MIDARRNPYVLQFLGLVHLPLAAAITDGVPTMQAGDHDAVAAPRPVYRPLIARIQQAPLRKTSSHSERTTSAEHRQAMHRHYKSTDLQHNDSSNGTSAAVGEATGTAELVDAEPEPEPEVATEVSEEVLKPNIGGGDGGRGATKIFEDDTSDEDEI